MNRPRIALIIDNPTRDLDGMVLLGKNLVDKGADVFLVPMYSQGFEVPAIQPDIVLMNYARPANVDLIKAYSAAGISVAVLDTEGGVWESEEFFANSISHKQCINDIDLYCVWGQAQYEALLKHTGFKKEQLAVTGCPRFDFYSPQLRNKMYSSSRLKSYILTISNFALAYPRYGSSEKEILNMIEYGFNREYAEAKYADELRSRRELIDTLKRLSQLFPKPDFIIRPHPFEDDSQYHSEFYNLKNIHVIREGVVGPWIRDANLVLHMNSSVAVDVFMLGQVALSLDWINSDLSRKLCTLSYDLSHKVKTEEELIEWIRKSEQGAVDYSKSGNFSSQIDPKSEKELENLFGPNDGRSAEKLSAALFKVLEQRRKKTNTQRCRQIAIYGSRSPKSLKGWVEGLGRFVFGANTTEMLRTKFRSPARKTKQLSLEKAQQILNSLVVKSEKPPKISVLKSDQVLVPRVASSSLYLGL